MINIFLKVFPVFVLGLLLWLTNIEHNKMKIFYYINQNLVVIDTVEYILPDSLLIPIEFKIQ